ncbi:MAG: hypothetical protein AAF192_20845, partial [Pseudomonadota bacterium]
AQAACDPDRPICEDLRAEAVTASPRGGVWRLLLSGAQIDQEAGGRAAACLADPEDPDRVRFVVEDAVTGPSIAAGMLEAMGREDLRVRVGWRQEAGSSACMATRVTFMR